ncbi:MAG TPA: hypothetical protein DEF34_03335 [Desulfotomaculum sp.]|nr:MAG: hypothetical protein JL56_02950 [Desulfotomaculum sp. BICA1-6]HBX22661.1 hypothetical protein [Desulfotomaculum sp.]
MSTLESELLSLLRQLAKDRRSRESRLAKALLKIYEESRKELYIKFLDAQGGRDTLKLEYLENTIRDIELQMKYYTTQATKARQDAIDEAFVMGQENAARALTAGGTPPYSKISVTGGVGTINRGMIEALVGNVPKLAGRVEAHVLNRIRDELARGAVMGESIPKIARRIMGTGLTQEGLKKPFPSIRARAITIARTEIIRASSAGFIDFADKAQEVIGEEIFFAWITAADGRVDPPCPSLANGTDSRFNSVPGMPGVYRRDNLPVPTIASHPRCRCRLVPVLRSWVKSGALNLATLKGRAA